MALTRTLKSALPLRRAIIPTKDTIQATFYSMGMAYPMSYGANPITRVALPNCDDRSAQGCACPFPRGVQPMLASRLPISRGCLPISCARHSNGHRHLLIFVSWKINCYWHIVNFPGVENQ
jgi:hypothetical protein